MTGGKGEASLFRAVEVLLVVGDKLLLTGHTELWKALPLIIEGVMPFSLSLPLALAKLRGADGSLPARQAGSSMLRHVRHGDRFSNFRD
jgi:hypothetical protein